MKGYGVMDLTEHGRAVWNDMCARLPRVIDSKDITVYFLGGAHG